MILYKNNTTATKPVSGPLGALAGAGAARLVAAGGAGAGTDIATVYWCCCSAAGADANADFIAS